jgi:hypothetical protein
MTVDAEHRMKLGLTGKRCSMTDKATQTTFLDIASHRITFRDRPASARLYLICVSVSRLNGLLIL